MKTLSHPVGNEQAITDEVLERIANTADPRVREISQAIVRHLQAFCVEVRPSLKEWRYGIDFLTRVGAMCSPTRQEFVLLSDTLGVSMLVDAINHQAGGETTETTVLGPFYVENPPVRELGAFIADGLTGKPLLVEGSVCDDSGNPIAGATVDVWHSDDDGFYDVQGEHGLDVLTGRARFETDHDGSFWFRSIVPRHYPIPDDGPVGDMLKAQGRHPNRPAHIHFMIAAPGCETLVTHLFVAGSPYLDSDVVFGVKDELIVQLNDQPAGVTERGNRVDERVQALRYDFILAPAR
ncbi:dioxygenase [Mesorhizobium sp. M0047]|uniref:dioxygenase family protein n=1 Tax=Mesorhizobium sp. M0047 TaxID=2956859 RepID=UPI0033358C80